MFVFFWLPLLLSLLIMNMYPTQWVYSFSVVQRSSSNLIKVRNTGFLGKGRKIIELIFFQKKLEINKSLALQPSSWTWHFFRMTAIPLAVGGPWLWAMQVCHGAQLLYRVNSNGLLKLPSSLWISQEEGWSHDPIISKPSCTKQLSSVQTLPLYLGPLD